MNFSSLVLGTAQFGMDYGIANRAGKPTSAAARDMIAYAWEHGVSCLDTAAAYGDSEAVIGHALQELELAGKMQIISKIANFPEDSSAQQTREHIRRSITESLQKLRIEALDVCLFHHEKYFYALDALAEAKESGLVKNIGLSFSGVDFDDAEKVLLSPIVDVVQVPANILDRRFEESWLNLAKERGVSLVTRSAYLQGLLLMETAPPHLQNAQPALDKIEEMAQRYGISREALCVRYALGINGGGVLMGADNLQQLQENIALINQGAFSPQRHQEIARALPMPAKEILCPALWAEA